MKVLFIVKPFKVELLGIAYLAASLKKSGHEVQLLKTDDSQFMTDIFEFKPQILAYSVCTGEHKRFVELNRKIKEQYSAISVFGGAHPTYFPDLIYENGVDFIIRGEAEKSFKRLLERIQLHKNVKRIVDFYPLEQYLDRLSFPDREFLYTYPENRNNLIKNVIVSRGCKFACPYCFNSIYRSFYKGQNWVRYRSVDNVIRECQELKEYPLELLYFQDDEFLTNPNLFPFLRTYGEEVSIPFHCQIRIELLTFNVAQRLKDAGCKGVTFAVESGNSDIRQMLLNRKMSKEKILRSCKVLRDVGLKFRIENMVGLPGESLDQMLETLDLNIKCKPTIAWASIFQPYPGLPLGEYAKKEGYWIYGTDDIKETFFEDTVLNTSLKREISNLQRLFSFIVSFPFLRLLVKYLIKLPRNRFYNWLYYRWKVFLFDRRLYKT